jgi:mono/diheme cytochrome c family protein
LIVGQSDAGTAMRRWVWIVLAVVVLAGIGVAAYMLRPVRGPERDLTLVGDASRGAYLIRIGGCVTCHTDSKNGGIPFAGGAALVTPFGSFYPPNITSDPDAGIGDWTLAQFSDAISNGEGPQGHLYPAFPYESYTLMSDQEVTDLFAALREIPAVKTPAPPHELAFPFNIRLLMAGWKNLFFHPHRFVPDPNQSAEWNRGAYLANGPGHCVTCHSPRNIFGAIPAGEEFTGNPAGGPGGKTPGLNYESLSTDAFEVPDIVETLRTGMTVTGPLKGAMAEVVRDETSQWTDADRQAVATYVFSLGQ